MKITVTQHDARHAQLTCNSNSNSSGQQGSPCRNDPPAPARTEGRPGGVVPTPPLS